MAPECFNSELQRPLSDVHIDTRMGPRSDTANFDCPLFDQCTWLGVTESVGSFMLRTSDLLEDDEILSCVTAVCLVSGVLIAFFIN
jgi:hypothetical protein